MREEARRGQARGRVPSDELGQDRLRLVGQLAPHWAHHPAREALFDVRPRVLEVVPVRERRTGLCVDRVDDAPERVEVV